MSGVMSVNAVAAVATAAVATDNQTHLPILNVIAQSPEYVLLMFISHPFSYQAGMYVPPTYQIIADRSDPSGGSPGGLPGTSGT